MFRKIHFVTHIHYHFKTSYVDRTNSISDITRSVEVKDFIKTYRWPYQSFSPVSAYHVPANLEATPYTADGKRSTSFNYKD